MGLSQIRTCGSSHTALPTVIPFGDEGYCKSPSNYKVLFPQTTYLAWHTARRSNGSCARPSSADPVIPCPSPYVSFPDAAFVSSSSFAVGPLEVASVSTHPILEIASLHPQFRNSSPILASTDSTSSSLVQRS